MRVYCDTHVHCYEFDEFELLLDSAYENLSRQALSDGQTEETGFVLFFTDGKTDKTWGKILQSVSSPANDSNWVLCQHQHSKLIQAIRGGNTLVLAPARQLVSREGLEFLLLGCDLDIEDGADASEIIENNQQFVVICPWGVGKWLGVRGKILSELIAGLGEKFLLGDNACRPGFWNKITHFNETENPVLNGSDPLPLNGEYARVGRFGLSFDLGEDNLKLENVLQKLNSADVEKQNFGQLMSFISFVKSRWGLFNR